MFTKLKNTFSQIINGSHKACRVEIMRNLSVLPEGKALIDLAAQNGIAIHVVGELGGLHGLFEKDAVYVLNTGNPAKMTLTLAHELHHARQFAEMGIADPCAPLSSEEIRSLHIQRLMIEADAFTTEAMLALRFLKAGQLAYLKCILESNAPPYTVMQDFFAARPYGADTDEASYRRALFTEVMLRGLPHYKSGYFSSLAGAVKKSDLQGLREERGKASQRVSGFPLPAGIAVSYGFVATGETSVRALSTAFLQTLPVWERKTLRLIEQVVTRAERVTEKEFRVLRDEIVRRCEEHSMEEDPNYSFSPSRRRTQAQHKIRQRTTL